MPIEDRGRSPARAGPVFRTLGGVAALLLLASALSPQPLRQEDIPSGRPAAVLSERVSNYRIDARLDPARKTITASQILTWRNTSDQPLEEFFFHLYLNAFKNNRTTFARELRGESFWPGVENIPGVYWGSIQIRSLEAGSGSVLPDWEITEVQYVQPDDGNPDDQTLLRVVLGAPVPPGEQIEFRMEFISKLPRGVARTGWVEDYYFAAQWFPKISAFRDGAWNAHQYHAVTEYFAEFGVYDVLLTVPAEYVVGATGRLLERAENEDGTATFRYYQEDVHDFAWVAGPRLLERKRLFTHAGLLSVELILLLQPEHRHLEERYFEAAGHALRSYGEWFGPYPYSTLTLVDPAFGSDTDAMEYPTFVTGRAGLLTPGAELSLEAVTVHEVGHQWWYGMVANNEFREAWLDEGINSWAEARVLRQAYEPRRYVRRYFGGIPLVFEAVRIPFETASLPAVRKWGTLDLMALAGWHYLDRTSHVVNTYYKPELVLWTLERYLGEERMLQALRTYFKRFRFRHPTTTDFIATVSEAAGEDLSWFFEETFFSSKLFDYAVTEASSRSRRPPEGYFDDAWGVPDYRATDDEEEGQPIYQSEVVVRRLQGGRFPVEVLMVFEDGSEIRERWDGRDLWRRYVYERPARLRSAVVDPDRVLLLDVDPINNSRWVSPEGRERLAARKWASRWLFWLQHLLETFAFIG